jgi:hypothetical protein
LSGWWVLWLRMRGRIRNQKRQCEVSGANPHTIISISDQATLCTPAAELRCSRIRDLDGGPCTGCSTGIGSQSVVGPTWKASELQCER